MKRHALRILVALGWLVSPAPAYCGIFAGVDEINGHELQKFKSTGDFPHDKEFRLQSAERHDADVEMCIPAAFTTTSKGIDGFAVCDGKKVGGPVIEKLTGTVILVGGDYEIIPTSMASQQLIADLQKDGASLFQQYQLVKDGIAQSFKDTKLFRRRALVVFANSDRGVVQSKEKLTMSQFADDLTGIGVRQAVYTPIADGDGGWYRDYFNRKAVSFGIAPSGPPVQSNWVVWRKAKGTPDPVAADRWLREHLDLAAKPTDSGDAAWKKAILNGEFPLPHLVGGGFDLVPLWNGSYKGGAGDPSVRDTAIGAVDGQPAAVSFVTWSTGGTGVWEILTLYRKKEGKIQPVGQYDLEDRSQLNSLRIANGAVIVDCMLHKPNDSAPNPSVHKILKLHGKDFSKIE